jgi:hypothetical protein
MAAAIAELFVLIPLMAYGSFELTVLLADRFYPQLLAAIIIGGLQQFSFWQSL